MGGSGFAPRDLREENMSYQSKIQGNAVEEDEFVCIMYHVKEY